MTEQTARRIPLRPRPSGEVDARVAAVLEVLAGASFAETAQRWGVEPPLLRRWVEAFVDAGTAQVTNRPDPEAARRRDRFLAAFAHEVRTPLSVAQGWVGVLGDEDLDSPVVARAVDRIDEALARLGERVTDVELLAAASLGRLRLEPCTVALRDLVSQLDVDIDEQDGDLVLHVDPELFPRVLPDLWTAGHALPAPRSVRLEVVEAPPWLEVRVVRDADPIEPRVLRALFEPFDVNDDATGVTIGLYLARALTVAHGGTLGVEQDETGAVLWVRVPAHPPD